MPTSDKPITGCIRIWALDFCPADSLYGEALCIEPCEACLYTMWDRFYEPRRQLENYPDWQIGSRLLAKLKAKGKR